MTKKVFENCEIHKNDKVLTDLCFVALQVLVTWWLSKSTSWHHSKDLRFESDNFDKNVWLKNGYFCKKNCIFFSIFNEIGECNVQ